MTQTTSNPIHSTQWPRWEIFKQDASGKVHQAVGSVHAGDPEHALLSARNVFVRRPAAVSLWAVREEHIYALTQEEYRQGVKLPDTAGEAQPYRIFAKKTHKRSMTFVDELGTVMAHSPQEALTLAQAEYGAELLVWWVIPAAAFVGTPEDSALIESWFAPAREKTYKQQSSYGVVGSHVSKHRARGAEADHA